MQLVHLLIVIVLALGLFVLVRRRLLQIDLSFPWFAAILLLAVAGTVPDFVDAAGNLLGILYPPLAVVFMVIFLMLGITITLSIAISRLHQRQILLVRHIAARELAAQECAHAMPSHDEHASGTNSRDDGTE